MGEEDIAEKSADLVLHIRFSAVIKNPVTHTACCPIELRVPLRLNADLIKFKCSKIIGSNINNKICAGIYTVILICFDKAYALIYYSFLGKIFAQLIKDFVLKIPERAYIRFFILIFTAELINSSSVRGVESAVADRDRYRK